MTPFNVRAAVVISATLLVVAYCVGLLAHVHSSPDLRGFRRYEVGSRRAPAGRGPPVRCVVPARPHAARGHLAGAAVAGAGGGALRDRRVRLLEATRGPLRGALLRPDDGRRRGLP